MRTTNPWRPVVERLRDALAGSSDVAAVAQTVFRTLARDVPYAFACLATTDPASGLITGAFKSEPLPLGDEEFAAAEYSAPDVNQFAEIGRRPVPVGVLSVDTDGRPEACRRMRDYMTPQFGFVDELRLGCRAQGATWALLGLYRARGEAFFTADDGELVATVGGVVADAVRRALLSAHPGRAGGPRVPVALVVDGADHVTGMSPAANDLVDDLGGWDHGALPASVLAVATSARASGGLVRTRVRGGSGAWHVLQGLPLAGADAAHSVVVTFEVASAAALSGLTIAARGLTAREQEVVELVLQGASTKTIAATLHLSPHTVQDHLKAVFAKLGVNSRRDLVAALGSS